MSSVAHTHPVAGRVPLRARFAVLAALLALLGNLTLLAGPARAAAVASARSGAWSSPLTWSGGSVPRDGDLVTIQPGDTVLYDVASDVVLGGVTVMGTLRFSRTVSTRLRTGGNVLVEDGGFLDMGVPVDPIPQGITAELYFVLTDAQAQGYVGGPDFEPTDIGLWVMAGGRWETNGAPLAWSWAKLATDAAVGASTIALEHDVTDWPAGGTIAISSSRNPKTFKPGTNEKKTVTWETENRRVASVQPLPGGRSQVVLDAPLSFAHSGTAPYRAEAGLLTRNVRLETTILGRSESDYVTNVRTRQFAHTMFMYGSRGSVRYTEFKYMGHYGKLSRYAIHAHMSQETGRGLVFEGNSGWLTGFRCVNVHAAFGVQVIDNVCYGSSSTSFFVEDAPDENLHNADNAFVHNLAVATQPKAFEDRNDNGVAGEDYLLSAFWPANNARHEAFLGNVAADTRGYSLNDEHVSGFFFPATGNLPPDVGSMPWTFVANEAHGIEDHGIHTWQNGVPPRDVVGSLLWRNGVSGIRWGAYSGKNRYYNAQILENGILGLDVTSVESFVQDSRIVGSTADGSRDDFGYRINSYVISQGPLRPLWIARNAFQGLSTGLSLDHSTCPDPSLETRPVIAGECSAVYATLIRNTFADDVTRPIDFGWQANANSFWRVFDQPLAPGGPEDSVALRSDQSDESKRTQLTGPLVTAQSVYQAGPDTLLTPMAALPSTIEFSGLPDGSTPPAPFDYTFTTAQDEPPSAAAGGPPAMTVTWNGPVATMRVDAIDDLATPRVEFLADWDTVAVDTAPPFQATVDLSHHPRKFAYLYARVLDGTSTPTGEQRAYTNVVEVGPGVIPPPDTTVPTVSVTAPAMGANVRGASVPVAATASDDRALARVDFLVDGNLVVGDDLSPYEILWDTTGLSDGSHLLEARAVDDSGNQASATLPVNVDNGPPGVSLTGPAANDLLRGTVNVAAGATDTVAVTAVEFLVDGVIRATDTSAPYGFSLDTTALSNASHALAARASDAAGNQTTASITVTVDNAAPSLSIATPAANAFLRGPVAVGASATDPNGVSAVEFLVDGVAAAPPDSSEPYGFSWDTTALANGTHTLGARATDAAGNPATAAIQVTVDNAAPSVSITAPAGGAFVKGASVSVTASAADGIGVAAVEFRVDGQPGSTDAQSPYAFAWNTAALADGVHALTARASDGAGNETLSSPVSVTVDNHAPAVSLTAPGPNAFVRGTSIVTADASDGVGVASVAFLVDGVVRATDATFPYEFSWTTTGLSDGAHTLQARATDGAGNVTTTAALSVTVDNTPPTVSLTAPAAGSTLRGTTTLTASASDTRGLDRVEFLIDGVVRSTDTEAPFAFDWDTTADTFGTHTVQARAVDRAGNQTTTASRSVTVDNRPLPDLVVQLADGPDPVQAGADLTYAITVRNDGSGPASAVSDQLTVPAGTALQSASASQGTCSGTGPVTCALGSLGTGASATVTVVVRPSGVGTLSATASASSSQTDANPANDQATASTQVVANAAGCTIVGTAGDDIISGTGGADVICGGGGNDKLTGGGGNDQLRGEAGNDTLNGGFGNDVLNGGLGFDSHYGDSGADALQAKDGVGNEVVNGGIGTDSCQSDPTDRRSSCP